MALHHQANESFTLRRRLGEELFSSSQNGFLIRTYFDLRYCFHRYGHALFCIKVLLRRDIERHELQRKLAAAFHHRKDDRAMALNDPWSTKAVDDEGLIGARFAKHLRQETNQNHEGKKT